MNMDASNLLTSNNREVSINLSRIISIKGENDTKSKKLPQRNEVMLADLFAKMDRNFNVRTVADIERDIERPIKTETGMDHNDKNKLEIDLQEVQITEDNERNKRKSLKNHSDQLKAKKIQKWQNPSVESKNTH